MSNKISWELRSHVICRDLTVLYYLKCNICDRKEMFFGKIIGDNVADFKSRINQDISECRTGIYTYLVFP